MADIEEANKIRAALGMPLLPSSNGASNLDFKPSASHGSSDSDAEVDDDPNSTLEKREAAGYDNWKRLQDEAAEKKRKEARRDALKKEREAAQRFAKLEGKGLGDADGTEADTRAWLLGARKREKKIAKDRARRLAQELAERENQAQYTDRDLAGKKVGHELGQFDDAGEQILTLKDAAVDDEDGEDELENAELREKEKLEERLRLKKNKPVYDPNDDDGTGERSILAQYDEEIDGKKQTRFTLDGMGRTTEETADYHTESKEPRGVTISLDFLKDEKPASDYLDISEVKVRKPKKKKEKSKRKRPTDEDDIVEPADNVGGPIGDLNGMEVDSKDNISASQQRSQAEVDFIDDDDLQSNLAMQRRVALKKRKLDRPEDIARRLREEASATPNTLSGTPDPEEEGGLVIDETTEFVSNLQKPTLPSKPTSTTQPSVSTTIQLDTAQIDPEHAPDSEEDSDVAMDETTPPGSPPPDSSNTITDTGLEAESTLSNGIGATLAMLTSRGLIKTAATGDLNAVYRERQRFLAEKQRRESAADRKAKLQRERDRASGKFDRMSAREREQYAQWENKARDTADSRAMAEAFNREYHPLVELRRTDEHGRELGPKESFKNLSHMFHGKGSGKGKMEKRLKKIEEEKRREAQSSLDASGISGMGNVAGETARKKRQAGIRLQ